MTPQRKQKLEQLLLDTAALISRIHDELGSWEYVEGFLVGAVDNHRSRHDFDTEDTPDADMEAEVLAGELAWKGGFNG